MIIQLGFTVPIDRVFSFFKLIKRKQIKYRFEHHIMFLRITAQYETTNYTKIRAISLIDRTFFLIFNSLRNPCSFLAKFYHTDQIFDPILGILDKEI